MFVVKAKNAGLAKVKASIFNAEYGQICQKICCIFGIIWYPDQKSNQLFFWNRKKEAKLLNDQNRNGNTYRKRIMLRFWNQRSSRWAVYALAVLCFVGIFADFLANEKPIYCVYEGQSHWPIFKSYGVDLGIASWSDDVKYIDWHEAEYDRAILPPIPYSASYLDGANAGFRKPHGPQQVQSNRYWHWLGTDQLGRDIAAGMIRGTRISLAVGIISMLVASLIGFFLGMISGYYGDADMKVSRISLFWYLLGIGMVLFCLLMSSQYVSGWKLLAVVLAIILLTSLLIKVSRKISVASIQKAVAVPVDILVMRLIEVINSFPALFTLLALVAVINKPSIILLMAVIGLIRWTSIARFTRAEMLKVRASGYIQSAKGLGLGDWTILTKYALPNVLPPVLITVAFGIAGAILLESFLSFLGIGVDPSAVTWGSLLQTARQNFSHWWLALFPGMAIFITVAVFNLIGNGLTKAMEG